MAKRKKFLKQNSNKKNQSEILKKEIDKFKQANGDELCNTWLQSTEAEIYGSDVPGFLASIKEEEPSLIVQDEGMASPPDISETNDNNIYTIYTLEESQPEETQMKIQIDDDDEIPLERKYLYRKTAWAKSKNHVLFACEWRHCNAMHDSRNEFASHVTEHSAEVVPNEGLYECFWDLCVFITTEKTALTRHINFHAYHTIIKTYGDSVRQTIEIPSCAYDSRNRNFFPDIEFDYRCDWAGCNRVFNLVLEFFDHVYTHCKTNFKARKQICQWEGCNRVCRNLAATLSHVKSHTKENAIACPHCGVMYKQNYRFFDHCKKQIAPQSEEFQCDICLKLFVEKRYMNEHRVKHRMNFECTVCGMKCHSNSTLAEHFRYRHMDEKPFTCNVCNYGAVRKRELDRHMQNHIQTIFECEVFGCNYTCGSNAVLRKHEIRVHEGEVNMYQCHLCAKNYRAGAYLSSHLKKKHKVEYLAGFTRFMYKPGDDGIFRLDPRFPQTGVMTKTSKHTRKRQYKRRAHKQSISTTDNDEEHENVIPLEEKSCAKVVDEDDECSISTVNFQDHAIDTEEEPDDHLAILTEENDNCIIKNIDNFKVMKYLRDKPKNKIEIDIIDSSNSKAESKIEVDEFIV